MWQKSQPSPPPGQLEVGRVVGEDGGFGAAVDLDDRYVSVEGPVVSEEDPDPAERLALARRYLGAAGDDRYVADNPDPGRENVAFRMRPEHWLSQDKGRPDAASPG